MGLFPAMTPVAPPVMGFDLAPTPDPSKWTVAYTVSIINKEDAMQHLPVSAWNTQGLVPTTYATWSDSGWGNGECRSQFGSYVYMHAEKPGPGLMTFFFSPAAASDAALVPYLEVPSFGKYPWPSILKSVDVPLDYGQQLVSAVPDGVGNLGQNNAPTPLVKYQFIEGADGGTRTTKRYFWNATPMQIGRYPVPITSGISYDLPGGRRGSWPDSLHPRIEIDDIPTAATQTAIVGSSNPGITVEGQVFPATDMEGWEVHTPEFSQEQSGAGFLAIQTIVEPPDEPDTITEDQ